MPLLALFDPASPQASHCSHLDSNSASGDGIYGMKEVGGSVNGSSWAVLQHLHRCAELCNILSIVVADGPEVKRTPSPGTDWVSLQVKLVHIPVASHLDIVQRTGAARVGCYLPVHWAIHAGKSYHLQQ